MPPSGLRILCVPVPASRGDLRGAQTVSHLTKPEDLHLFGVLENVEGLAVTPRNSARMQDSAPPAKRIRRNHVPRCSVVKFLENRGILSTCDAVRHLRLTSGPDSRSQSFKIQYACFRGLRDDCKACSKCEHCRHTRLGAKNH